MTPSDGVDEATVEIINETGGDNEDNNDSSSGNDRFHVHSKNAIGTSNICRVDVNVSTAPASMAICSVDSAAAGFNQRRNHQHTILVRRGPRGRIITEDEKLQRRLLANRKSAAASRTKRLNLIEQLKKTVLELSTRVDQLQSENYELRLRLSTGSSQEATGGPSSSILQHYRHPPARQKTNPILTVTPHPPPPPPPPLPPNLCPTQFNLHLPVATDTAQSPTSTTTCRNTQPSTQLPQQQHQELQHSNSPNGNADSNLLDTQQHHHVPLVSLNMHGYFPPPPQLLCDKSIMPFSFNTSVSAYPSIPFTAIGTSTTNNETNVNFLRPTTATSSVQPSLLYHGRNNTTYENIDTGPQYAIIPRHTLNTFPVEQDQGSPRVNTKDSMAG
jgi:hypothetical protein